MGKFSLFILKNNFLFVISFSKLMVQRKRKVQRAIKCVIFDLDGTLTFFKIDYMAARREIINKLYEFGIPKDLISVKQRIMEVI